jgi:hypothetical protein
MDNWWTVPVIALPNVGEAGVERASARYAGNHAGIRPHSDHARKIASMAS